MPKGSIVHFGKEMLKEIRGGNIRVITALQYYPKWRNSFRKGRNSVTDEQPWITFPVISMLKGVVDSKSKVFEYGGGGSTLFFVNRAAETVTVEHDEEWFHRLKAIIEARQSGKWIGNLVLPEAKTAEELLDPSKPGHYFSADAAFAKHTFRNYAASIDTYPDEYFDIVLVDGRVRPSCTIHGIPKLKKGGLLVIDNSDRGYYFKYLNDRLDKDFELIFDQKEPSPYVDFFTQTGVWRKR